jgi:hypothetical protein
MIAGRCFRASTPMFFVRTLLLRRLGPVGVALTAYDLWRRVPLARRRRLRAAAWTHGAGALRRSRRLLATGGRR